MKLVSRFCNAPSETVPISPIHIKIIPELKQLYDPFLEPSSVLPIDIVKNDITIFNDRLRSQKDHFVAKMKELDLQHRKAREFLENHFQTLLQVTSDQLMLEKSKFTTLDESFSIYRRQTEEQIEDLRDSLVSMRSENSKQKLSFESRISDDAKKFEVQLTEQTEVHETENRQRRQVQDTISFVLFKVEERITTQREQELILKHEADMNLLNEQFAKEKAFITSEYSFQVQSSTNKYNEAVASVRKLSESQFCDLKCLELIRGKISVQQARIMRISHLLSLIRFTHEEEKHSDPVEPTVIVKEPVVIIERHEVEKFVTVQKDSVSVDTQTDEIPQVLPVYHEVAQEIKTEPLTPAVIEPVMPTIVIASNTKTISPRPEDKELKAKLLAMQADLQTSHTQIAILVQRETELVNDFNRLQSEKEETMAILSSIVATYESSSRVIPVPEVLMTTCNLILSRIQQDVKQGSSLWKLNKKEECFDLYMSTCQECCKSLLQLTHDTSVSEASKVEFRTGESSGREAIRTCLRQSQAGGKAKSAVGLRKWIDSCQQVVSSILQAPVQVEQAGLKPENCIEFISKLKQIVGDSIIAEPRAIMVAEPTKMVLAEPKTVIERAKSIDEAPLDYIEPDTSHASDDDDELNDNDNDNDDDSQPKAQGKTAKVSSKQKEIGAKKQDAANARQLKEKENKIRKLEDQVKKLNDQLATASTTETSNVNSAALQRQIQKLETTSKKQSDDSEKKAARDKAKFEADIAQMTTRAQTAEDQAQKLSIQVESLRGETSLMSNMQAQVEALQLKANETERIAGELSSAQTRVTEVEDMYKQEMMLRKKYWNMLEDMKGKIRVYSRCRPMAGYEIEKGCQQCIQFMDATTIDIIGAGARGGNKTFSFDSSFQTDSTQDAVFEDCRNLVQSCIDGFNVCIFAYGQTGSGKTFTMTGSDTLPGLTPRAVREIFSLTAPMIAANKAEVTIESYFVELYNDGLVDLYFKLDNLNDRQALADPPKVEIKVDPATKMVVLKNTVMKPITSDAELMSLFRRANDLRHTGATKMNAASSRSHSVFAIQVVVRDRTTNKVSVGKLSLVDLAGSERADKTGASGERLREAQSINLSLSALGDVINALSTNEKFIPYRNNKLTQLMQDSLGGNAKTLMFVNISPADYNMDETVSALNYASRVKLITNQASKNSESTEIARLKEIIKRLKSGQSVDDDDGPNNSNNEQKQSIEDT